MHTSLWDVYFMFLDPVIHHFKLGLADSQDELMDEDAVCT